MSSRTIDCGTKFLKGVVIEYSYYTTLSTHLSFFCSIPPHVTNSIFSYYRFPFSITNIPDLHMRIRTHTTSKSYIERVDAAEAVKRIRMRTLGGLLKSSATMSMSHTSSSLGTLFENLCSCWYSSSSSGSSGTSSTLKIDSTNDALAAIDLLELIYNSTLESFPAYFQDQSIISIIFESKEKLLRNFVTRYAQECGSLDILQYPWNVNHRLDEATVMRDIIIYKACL